MDLIVESLQKRVTELTQEIAKWETGAHVLLVEGEDKAKAYIAELKTALERAKGLLFAFENKL